MKRTTEKPAEEMKRQDDCVFSPNAKPIATASPGEILEIETYDCFGNSVRPERDWKTLLES